MNEKIQLLPGPTPLEPMHRLGDYLGLEKLYVKRDDEGGRGGGGNKLRKFERQLASALAKQADCIVIPGHPQSNAARELAGTARRLGLEPIIVSKRAMLYRSDAMEISGNSLLIKLTGAQVIVISDEQDLQEELNRVVASLREAGRNPFVLPFGASDVLGIQGYADCATELIEQLGEPPDWVVLATGTGGTQAGLLLGFEQHQASTAVLGMSILKSRKDAVDAIVDLLRAAEQQGSPSVPSSRVLVDDRALGEGYGSPTQECLDAVRVTATMEGLFLEPVYTGKAMAGLMRFVRENKIHSTDTVVFLHTGGVPLLFAFADAF